MTDLSMALYELLRKYKAEKDEDVLRDGVRLLAHQLMEIEVNEKAGAEKCERSPERTAYRNGYRERDWDTRVGTIPLRIPRLRTGTYFPSLIEPRRRAERAIVSVIQEAYVHGVSTRKVDDLVRALGMDGISRSEVSRLCSELDAGMHQFRDRQLEGEYPYVWLDGKCVKVRYGGRVEKPGRRRRRGRQPERSARDPRLRRRTGGEPRLLARVPAQSRQARTSWNTARDLRCP